ncbi:MAG: hypothetical protein WCH39_11850 [Schlesneria sp.]
MILILTTPFLLRAWFIAAVPDIRPFDEDAFCKVDIPDEQNAFTFYRKAGHQAEKILAARTAGKRDMPIEYMVETMDEVVVNGWGAANDWLKAWCQDYRQPLEDWRKGTELSDAFYLSPREIEFKVDVTNQFPVLSQSRHFARLARFEGLRLEHEGEFSGAMEWYMAIFRCGRHLTYHAFNLQRMTGSALHAAASASLARWAEDSHVTRDQLQTALREVRTANRMTDPISSTFKAEYLLASHTLNQRGWLQSMEPDYDDDVGNEPAETLTSIALWMFGEPQTTQRILRQILSNQLKEIDKPLSEQQPEAGLASTALFQPNQKLPGKPDQLDPVKLDQAVSRLMLTRIFVPSPQSFEQLTELANRDRARQAALEIGLAAQAHRREHGEFPEDSTSLLPTYFDQWPVDPFSPTGQPMQYRRENATSATIWSVGTNSNDDNGEVSYSEQKPAKDVGIVLKSR